MNLHSQIVGLLGTIFEGTIIEIDVVLITKSTIPYSSKSLQKLGGQSDKGSLIASIEEIYEKFKNEYPEVNITISGFNKKIEPSPEMLVLVKEELIIYLKQIEL